ncbi:metalloregulator ArsR/SmtB family transcription factor [soil metagenome]
MLGALADPTRRRVVELLGNGPVRAGELAAGVGLPPTTITRHLKTLREAGVVDVEATEGDARGRLYRLRVEQMASLGAWVDQVSAFWAEQLAGFEAHAKRKARRR